MPDLAKIAYEAYREFHNRPGNVVGYIGLPRWEDLDNMERNAWSVGIQAALMEMSDDASEVRHQAPSAPQNKIEPLWMRGPK